MDRNNENETTKRQRRCPTTKKNKIYDLLFGEKKQNKGKK